MSIRRFLLILILISVCQIVEAQNKVKEKAYSQWQIGANLGFSQYYGDISNKNYFQKFNGEIGFSISGFGRYHFDPLWGVGLNIHGGNIGSTKVNFSNGDVANLECYAGIFNFDGHFYLNMSNLFWGMNEKRKLDLYGTAGIGFIRWNSWLGNSITGEISIENGTVVPGYSYKTSSAYFPVALGVEYKVTPNLGITAEVAIYTVFSDDVDFYNDGFGNDILSFTSIGLTYHFGVASSKKERKPPVISSPSEPVKVIDYDVFNTKPIKSSTVIPALTITDNRTTEPMPFEFRVQVLAHSSKVDNIKRYFPNVVFDYELRENHFGGIYRYSTGSFQSFSQAEAYSQTMRSRGIHDAFVVAYENNIRITISPDMKRK